MLSDFSDGPLVWMCPYIIFNFAKEPVGSSREVLHVPAAEEEMSAGLTTDKLRRYELRQFNWEELGR